MSSFGRACPFIVTVTLASTAVSRAQLSKENNADALNLTSSWAAGSVPGAADIAQWDSQVSGANSSDLGAATSWLGIRLLNPGGAVTITGTSPNTLTLGSSGIDMSAATQNLTISSPLVLGSAQTWSVAAGRMLNITTAGVGAISGTGPLTINGPGGVRLGGLASTYTFTGGITVTGGTGLKDVSALPGGTALINAANLVFDLAAIATNTNSGVTLNTPALTGAGGTIHTIGGARASTGTPAWITSSSLTLSAGNTNFTQTRGSSARVINQFSSIARSVGATANFRDALNSNGTNNANTGGYRVNNAATVNGIVPYITFTTTSTNTSWFVPSALGNGTANNGTAYSAFTSSTATTLGTATQNSTVVTNVDFTGLPAATVNSIRFNDTTAYTVTIDAAAPLTIGAGAILVTNNGTANHTITGGTLMGGSPGSGSANDLIIHQLNNASTFTIDSVIADNVTATALTKTGAGTLVVGGQTTYTGATFVNAGTLLVTGALNGSASTRVNTGGALGGTGSVSGPISLESGGKITPGLPGGIESLDGSSLTWNSDNAVPGMTFDLSAVDNTADLLSLTGTFAKGAGTSFLWDLSGGMTDTTYTLATFASHTFAGAGDFAITDTSAPGFFTLNGDSLQFTTVPEPQGYLMLLGGLGTLALVRRRAVRVR